MGSACQKDQASDEESDAGSSASGTGGRARPKKFLIDNEDKLLQDHFDVEMGDGLGQGGFATVVRGRNLHTNAVRAIKIVTKKRSGADKLRTEIDALADLDHPNIARLFQIFEDSQCVYMVLELCSGGELFDRVVEAGHFTERQAAELMHQVFGALRHTHAAGVAHHDIKPENLLFLTRGPIESSTLKLVDFGSACNFVDQSGAFLESARRMFALPECTPSYVAPEVLRQGVCARACTRYGAEWDVWSAGVVMYVLLSGMPPFQGRHTQATLEMVRRGKYNFPDQQWAGVSEDAKSLVRSLLQPDPEERFTAEQALQDPWIDQRASRPKEELSLHANHIESLRAFHSKSKFKQVALQVISKRLGESDIHDLRDLFAQLDSDGDGHLTAAELRDGLDRIGLENVPNELTQIMESVDCDGSGFIDYTEFLAALLDRRQYHEESVCWDAFRYFDRNDDGRISQRELETVLNAGGVAHLARREVEDLMAQYDTDKDGYIDFQEFMAMMRSEH